MSSSEAFLERVWIAVSPEGREVTATIRVSFPLLQATGEWTSVVSLEQLADRPDTIHGADSWQAVELAMQHAAVRIAHFQELGWSFFWDANDRVSGEAACAADLYKGIGARI